MTKLTVTDFAWLMVTLQVVPDAEVQPDQLLNLCGEIGLAVRVTLLFAMKLDVQLEPQLIPVGLLVTVPYDE